MDSVERKLREAFLPVQITDGTDRITQDTQRVAAVLLPLGGWLAFLRSSALPSPFLWALASQLVCP